MISYFFDVWIIPIIIFLAVVAVIGFVAIRKMKTPKVVLSETDHSIGDAVQEHPFTVNPVLWVILLGAIFIGIVIFYYWASSIY